MNKYQKVLKEAAQTNICGRIGCLIYDDFIFCFAPLEKNKRTKKINHLYKKKKINVCGAILLIELPPFFCLPPSLVFHF